ncbi:MAG: hypothetical protein U9R25_12250, partial [Chloroflexota bacterium]|nr:hypothetical protein [Chloroflexota bacterium]
MEFDFEVHSQPQDGELRVGDDERLRLRQELEAGEFDHVEFGAVVFRDGANSNHFRFRAEDLEAFGVSFESQPFLRDHDVRKIESRDGTIMASRLEGGAFKQTIRLTTERGMRSFLEGQIDRFSIGWYFDGITCSVCNEDWLGGSCRHWPGRTYQVKDEDGRDEDRLCELIFENPRGKETSAVNAPAVEGTGILSQLCDVKETMMAEAEENMDERIKSEKLKHRETETETAVSEVAVSEPLQDRAQDDVWGRFVQEQALGAALVASGLPVASQAVVREQLGEEYQPNDVERVIGQQKALVASLQKETVVQG